MVTRAEIEEYAEIERAAVADASKRGHPPRLEAPHAALFVGIGVYFLLEVFGAFTVPDWEPGYRPAVVLAVLCAAGAYGIQRYRERAWRMRVDAARTLIEADRDRQRGRCHHDEVLTVIEAELERQRGRSDH